VYCAYGHGNTGPAVAGIVPKIEFFGFLRSLWAEGHGRKGQGMAGQGTGFRSGEEEIVSAVVRRWLRQCVASAAGDAGGSVETSCYPGAIDRCLRGFTWQDS